MNVHLTSDPHRVTWALLGYSHDDQGVPHARMQAHGVTDLQDLDPVGIDAVVVALLVAAERTA